MYKVIINNKSEVLLENPWSANGIKREIREISGNGEIQAIVFDAKEHSYSKPYFYEKDITIQYLPDIKSMVLVSEDGLMVNIKDLITVSISLDSNKSDVNLGDKLLYSNNERGIYIYFETYSNSKCWYNLKIANYEF